MFPFKIKSHETIPNKHILYIPETSTSLLSMLEFSPIKHIINWDDFSVKYIINHIKYTKNVQQYHDINDFYEFWDFNVNFYML